MNGLKFKNHCSMKLQFWCTGTFCLHLHFWIMLLLSFFSFFIFSFSCKIPVVIGGLRKGEPSLCWILSLLVQTTWRETHGQHDKMKLNVNVKHLILLWLILWLTERGRNTEIWKEPLTIIIDYVIFYRWCFWLVIDI